MGREVPKTEETLNLPCVLELSMWAKILSVVPDEDLQPGSYDDN